MDEVGLLHLRRISMLLRIKRSLICLLALVVLGAPAGTSLAQIESSRVDGAVFAGGCFWGVDAVFRHVKGVSKVISGYAGGSADTANYETVSTSATGHAESVEVSYDPSQVSYEDLLKVFFLVAHDPTELNQQGPDSGSQYRSAIFYTNDHQRKLAQAYIEQLDHKKVFSKAIVTEVVPLNGFYPAEAYHQNYVARHYDQPYIAINDLPKLERLQKTFPALYRQ